MNFDLFAAQKKNVLRHLKSGINFLYKKLIEPKTNTEDERRKEFILNVIIVGSIIFLSALDIFILFDSIKEKELYEGIPLLDFSLILIFFFALFQLSRRGFIKLSSYLLIAVYFFGATYGMFKWGVGMQMSLLTYVLIIVISSILISTQFSFLVAFCLSICGIILGHLQTGHILSPEWYWEFNPESHLPEEFSFMFFLIVTVSWLSNREIDKSLLRARKYEDDLREERDMLEIKIEKRTEELRRVHIDKISQLYRFAEFGRLSSGLFHDLMKPLTTVVLNMDEIKTTIDPHIGESKRYLEKAVDATKRMERFISGVQKQIKMDETYRNFLLNEEIEQVIDLLEFRAKKMNVSLNFQASKNIHLYGNPIKFHQIVMNLAANAIDSYIGTGNEKTGRSISISLSETNAKIILKVNDDGTGISPEILTKIFDPFFTTKSKHLGTGLGLSTTKNSVVKDFGGEISVTSTQGIGSTFTVIIPS